MKNSEEMEADEEPMDFEDIVFYDSSSSSDESVTQPLGKYYCSKGIEYKNICFYIHSFWIYTKYSSPTSHRAQIPSSNNEVTSDGSELEFARSNDDDGDSSRVEDQQEQGGRIRGRGVCNKGEGAMDVDLEEGMAKMDVGLSVKQCVEWDGRDTSGITQDQLILNGPRQGKESNALNYFWLYFAIFI